MPLSKRKEFRACMAWSEAAGPEMGAISRPLRLSGGTLVVATTNAVWATELGYISEELRDRLNAILGEEVVTGLRFVAKPEPESIGDE